MKTTLLLVSFSFPPCPPVWYYTDHLPAPQTFTLPFNEPSSHSNLVPYFSTESKSLQRSRSLLRGLQTTLTFVSRSSDVILTSLKYGGQWASNCSCLQTSPSFVFCALYLVKKSFSVSQLKGKIIKIIGERQESLNVLYERRCVQKGKAIMSDSKHVLVDFFEVLPSGRRIKESKCRTTRTKKSFVPQAIRLLNKHIVL